jgi:hypothetical protein
MQHDFILLDRSGSMDALWSEAINSVNGYVKKLADDGVDTGVTLAAFDSGPTGGLDFAIVRDRVIPQSWSPVSATEITPRNSTPLNDAIARLVAMAKAGNYDKCAIIIMTDGYENASREFCGVQGHALVRAMLDECRTKGWQVIMLGANFDNAAQAASYGVRPASAIQSSTRNLWATVAMAASKRAEYAAGIASNMEFTDAEKALLKQK